MSPAPRSHLEIEAKYDLTVGQSLPELIGVSGVETIATQPEMTLRATYFDTADHALAAAGATLRRRTGGTDDGWHLKLPLADGERLEVQRPLGRGQAPPAALTALIRGFLRNGRLEAVATLVTLRTVHHLLAADGRIVAELADDSVTGERHAVEGHSLTWRELEVELVEGDRADLAGLDAAVLSAGVLPAGGGSKVGRVLGTSTARRHEQPALRRKSPAGDVLAAGLTLAVLDLQAADPLVRLDRPGGPSRMRAAIHRLRAALALQRQVVSDERISSVRAELDWLDSVVAELEQVDVTRERLRAALGEQPKGLVLGPVSRRIDREAAADRKASLAAVREVLDSPRYLGLVEDVVQLPSRARDTSAGTGRAGDVLPDLADRALRRAERRLAQLARAQSDDERRWEQRGASRAIDRARCAEFLVSLIGGSSAGQHGQGDELIAALDETAALLTELAAATAAQEVLLDLAVRAHGASENGFTFGLLDGLEQARAAGLARRAKKLGKNLRRLRQP